MSATDTMKWMGKSARSRASAVGHSLKDRALEKRLEHLSDEADRLRLENDVLRDEVSETREEHHRILDALEKRLSEPEIEVEVEKRSHRGRWLLFLMAVGGGAYAWTRARTVGDGRGEWMGRADVPTVTETSTSTM